MEYGAIDLHTQHSEVLIVREDGAEVLSRRIDTRPERVTAVFGGRARLRVLIETGTESEWVAQHLEGLGHEVVVADPNYAPMYGDRRRRIKTDRRDVVALAEANRRGLFRPAHRVSPAQRQVRRALLVRTALIRVRTQLINVTRAQVRGVGARIARGEAETFGRRVRRIPLPDDLTATVAPLLAQLDALAPMITAADRTAAAQAQADPITVRLMTAPGVGPVTALHVRATLDRVDRFPDAAAVSAYLGLVPREHSSGERRQRGRITKAGARDTRAMLVQAAWCIWRMKDGPGAPLSAWAHRLAARRGRAVAIVALARRLARVLFAMWRDGRHFEPAGRAARVAA
jgi:transposase